MGRAAGKNTATAPPIVAIVGDEEFLKHNALKALLDRLLPPSADRGMALVEYEADRNASGAGVEFARVADDLGTLPFLADRRVVVIRNADAFVTLYRKKLEAYATRPSPTATLVMMCRSFPSNTNLAKTVASIGQVVECKRLKGPALTAFVQDRAQAAGKKIDYPLAAKIVELVGSDQGALSNEVEKLCLLASDRPTITAGDVSDLVGQTREEIVFAAMDAAAAGRLPQALAMWSQTLATNKAAAFIAVGGVAWKLRSWIAAHEMLAARVPLSTIASKIGLWGRVPEAESLLRRLSLRRVKRLLADLAELDGEAKVGARSIEMGVEALLVELAA